MLLGFYPDITINHDWSNLVLRTQQVSEKFVKTGNFLQHLIYTQGASQVSTLPTGGWISKSAPSQDFFVMGGISETDTIGERFKEKLPMLTWTPPTIGCTTSHVPEHRDHAKNGRTSLVYPISDNPSLGIVRNPDSNEEFYYLHQTGKSIMINITVPHRVYVHAPRIWFTLHCMEPIEKVREVFDNLGAIVI